MDIWNDALLMERDPMDRGVEARFPASPVDALLRVYLGQSRGSRAPESVDPHRFSDAPQDLWDHLGDFA